MMVKYYIAFVSSRLTGQIERPIESERLPLKYDHASESFARRYRPEFDAKGEGRIYVVSSKHDLGKGDALFLSHIGAQTFPAIENIELAGSQVCPFTNRKTAISQ